MTFNLSVVNIINDAERDELNQLAFNLGCGENNLSVKLLDSDNNIFWGCHSFWTVEDYAFFKELDTDIGMTSFYERVVLNGDAQENWLSALGELNLSIAEE